MESSVLGGTCGRVVPEIKDLQKLRCDEFVGEDVVLFLGSLFGLQGLVPLSWQWEGAAGTCCLLAGGFVYHQLFSRDISGHPDCKRELFALFRG